MQDVYAETVSAIHFTNGIVRILLVDQDPAVDEETIAPRLKQQIVMPLAGFMYMLSIARDFLEDPKMKSLVEAYVDMGMLPKPDGHFATPKNDKSEEAALSGFPLTGAARSKRARRDN